MQKKLISIALCTIFVFSLIAVLPQRADAQNPYYSFRSTVMGSGVRQTGRYAYEISGEKNSFSANESPYFLTRIFNITDVDRFQFKHHIRGNSYNREIYSPVYNPGNKWWSEIYYWDELGKLPAGNYDIQSFVSVNGGYFQLEKTVSFSVYSGDSYYGAVSGQTSFRPADSYSYFYAQEQNYSFNWTHIGKNVRKTGQYSYEIDSQANTFTNNEDVYALAKISNISGVDNFQVKFDVYTNGNRYTKTNEVGKLWPHGQVWADNYSWANLGKLANGYYEIRTSISVNGGAYTRVNTQTINVGSQYRRGERGVRREGRRENSYRPEYNFDWTHVNTKINNLGTSKYDMADRSGDFYNNEDIKALTKLSNIRNIGYFQVKLDLYQDGTFKREYLAVSQKPDGKSWGYNYTQSDLGQLSEGDYILKAYVSVDGSSFQFVGHKNFTVKMKKVEPRRSYRSDHGNREEGRREYHDNWSDRRYDYYNSEECTGYYSCENNYYRGY